MEELTKKGAEMAQKSLQKLEEVGTKTLESLKEEVPSSLLLVHHLHYLMVTFFIVERCGGCCG